jgi:RNA polymerase sigma factor (sigma-70 family)
MHRLGDSSIRHWHLTGSGPVGCRGFKGPVPPPLWMNAVANRWEYVGDGVPCQTHRLVVKVAAPAPGGSMNQQSTDCEVILASRRRPELFEVIFERHYQAVYRFAVGRAGVDDAGDIAADTFVRAFDRRDRFRTDRECALPWLFGIAANVARERRRKSVRRHRMVQRSVALVAGDDARFEVEAAERVDALSQRPELTAALATLTEDEYQVLMLLAIADFSYPDISEYLGIPIGTVRSRIHRARRKMRELMEAERPIVSDPAIHGRYS